MTDIGEAAPHGGKRSVRSTGSPMLDQIRDKRIRLNELYYQKRIVPAQVFKEVKPEPIIEPPKRSQPALRFPPLPQCVIKSVEERIVEAEKFRGQIPARKMKKIIDAIHRSARDFGEPISSEICPEIASPGHPTIAEIQQVVASHFNVSHAEIQSALRTARMVRPRFIAMYLAKLLGPAKHRSSGEIGRRFGGRDHTTVLHAVCKITRLIETDKALADEIAALKTMLS